MSAVNAKTMESDKVVYLQQEVQNAQNEVKDMKNQMQINAAEVKTKDKMNNCSFLLLNVIILVVQLKGILDEKSNLQSAVLAFKTEVAQLRE